MSEKIFIVYKTDNQHSYKSRDVIGLSEFRRSIMAIILNKAEKEGEKITQTDMYNLASINQTQGYQGEGEFHYEELELNTLI